jgi:AraC-like DNA-binding protein
LTVVGAALQGLPGTHGNRPSNMAAYHLARVRAYIEENVRDPCLTIASIAAAMKISPDHLSRVFREEPVAPSRLIWLRRLEGARRDLADPRLNDRGVSEIAFSWGYSDAAHFSRSFKEQYGVSPREWRSFQKGGGAGDAAIASAIGEGATRPPSDPLSSIRGRTAAASLAGE